ncbi:hypothetical protein AB0C52_23720 [Streptomyces sp. NPDC048717]|uniref:hypothetical protein n=1 Tax=Streptomyces sp. NPDC048717 TaxID=3154928 RepID=UPI0034318E31
MTTILEQLDRWREAAEAGPALWQEAWDRTIELGQDPWAGKQMMLDTPVLAEGAAALTTIFYILADEHGVRPRDVTRAQVDAYCETAAAGGATTAQQQVRWEERLTALGHDLNDPADPVAAIWRRITISHGPRPGAPDEVWEDSLTRWGPGFTAGLRKVFAPAYQVALD